MRHLLRVTAALAACTIAACTTEETPINAPISTDEIEGAVVSPVTCAGGAAVCSGSTGNVYSSLYRVGRSSLEVGEIAQTFKVGTTGFPGRVRLKMRLLKDLPATGTPMVQVEIREVTSPGVVPNTSAATFAKGMVAASTLPRGRPADVEFVLFQTGGTSVTLSNTKNYALVVNVVDGDATPNTWDLAGGVYVGVASHRDTAPYAAAGGSTNKAYRRGVRSTTANVFADAPFYDYGADDDLSFSLTQGDGGAPAACWSTLMVWGSSLWNDDGIAGAGSLCSG